MLYPVYGLAGKPKKLRRAVRRPVKSASRGDKVAKPPRIPDPPKPHVPQVLDRILALTGSYQPVDAGITFESNRFQIDRNPAARAEFNRALEYARQYMNIAMTSAPPASKKGIDKAIADKFFDLSFYIYMAKKSPLKGDTEEDQADSAFISTADRKAGELYAKIRELHFMFNGIRATREAAQHVFNSYAQAKSGLVAAIQLGQESANTGIEMLQNASEQASSTIKELQGDISGAVAGMVVAAKKAAAIFEAKKPPPPPKEGGLFRSIFGSKPAAALPVPAKPTSAVFDPYSGAGTGANWTPSGTTALDYTALYPGLVAAIAQYGPWGGGTVSTGSAVPDGAAPDSLSPNSPSMYTPPPVIPVNLVGFEETTMRSGMLGLAGIGLSLAALGGEPHPWEHEIRGKAIAAETMPDGRRKITLENGSFLFADASDIMNAKKLLLTRQGYDVFR